MQNKELKQKKLVNTRMLKNTGSWIYCNSCNKTVAYLCYTTYSYFKFSYTCQCGNIGLLEIGKNENNDHMSKKKLILKKNRLCCPIDDSSLFSIVNKHTEASSFKIICKSCKIEYSENKL
jgi:hypothetical protein